jgi:DNA-binding transcriptional MerR regulator
MFKIQQVSEQTGLTTHTLRYYEKIGVLPAPERQNGGARIYTEADVNFMLFISGLKKTGMSLADICAFVQDGCILEKIKLKGDLSDSITTRIEILSRHLNKMEALKQEIEDVISKTEDKISIYCNYLNEQKKEQK